MLFITSGSFCQSYTGLAFQSGLNRIGVYLEPSFFIQTKGYRFGAGIKYYGLNQMFEQRYPGFVIKNGYFITSKKGRNSIGFNFSSAFFLDKKTTVNLLLTDFMLGLAGEVHFLHRFSFYPQPGIGWVTNIVFTSSSLDKNAFTYLNYEFAFGIKYRFSTSPDY